MIEDFDRWLVEAPPPEAQLEDLLVVMRERQVRGSHFYYRAFAPQASKTLREHFRRSLPAWAKAGFDGGDEVLINEAGTQISRGWSRIVVGDYGAFVELSPERACRENYSVGTGGDAYNWLRTFDRVRTKVYEQLRGVAYADYKPGRYYVAPDDVRPA